MNTRERIDGIPTEEKGKFFKIKEKPLTET